MAPYHNYRPQNKICFSLTHGATRTENTKKVMQKLKKNRYFRLTGAPYLQKVSRQRSVDYVWLVKDADFGDNKGVPSGLGENSLVKAVAVFSKNHCCERGGGRVVGNHCDDLSARSGWMVPTGPKMGMMGRFLGLSVGLFFLNFFFTCGAKGGSIDVGDS
jgi:hypothetical protein